MKDSAFENFGEGVMDAVYDFARCQRPDGSYYGTSGQCRKGTQTGAKEKAAPKAKAAPKTKAEPKAKAAAGGAPTAKEVRALDKTAKAANKKADASDKAYQKAAADARKAEAKATPDMRASRANPGDKALADKFRVSNMEARNARDKAAILKKTAVKDDKAAKKADKAADKADKAFQKSSKAKKSPTAEAKASTDPAVQKRVLQTELKKVSARYEKLRGNPEAAAERKALMDRSNEIVKAQKAVQKRIDSKTAAPRKPDTSPAANQRRADAAARAKD